MRAVTAAGESLISRVFAIPGKRRIETHTPDGIIVTFIDIKAREAFAHGKDGNGPMGIYAVKLDYDASIESMAADLSSAPSPVYKGNTAVADHRCHEYQTAQALSCVTYDGILLRAAYNNGDSLEMTSMTRAPQPPYLFGVPNGYVITEADEGALGHEEEGFTVEGFMGEQAKKQTKKKIKSMAKKQIGDNVGGAIGGGFIGATVGNEVGKLAQGLVSGLFGKKKKKAKAVPGMQETPEALEQTTLEQQSSTNNEPRR